VRHTKAAIVLSPITIWTRPPNEAATTHEPTMEHQMLTFPILTNEEIVECMDELRIPVTMGDLSRVRPSRNVLDCASNDPNAASALDRLPRAVFTLAQRPPHAQGLRELPGPAHGRDARHV